MVNIILSLWAFLGPAVEELAHRMILQRWCFTVSMMMYCILCLPKSFILVSSHQRILFQLTLESTTSLEGELGPLSNKDLLGEDCVRQLLYTVCGVNETNLGS